MGTDHQRSIIWGASHAGPSVAPIRRLIDLANADMNEAAANSQAVATRQAQAVPSLVLAS